MIADLCMSPRIINGLYSDEFVQERMGESALNGFIENPQVFYVGAKEDDEWIACALVIIRSVVEFEFHPCIPGKQKAKSNEILISIMDWLFANSGINRVTTKIVCCYPQVANYAEKFGFSFEGTARASCSRGDEFIDAWLYAMVRGDDYGRADRHIHRRRKEGSEQRNRSSNAGP